MKPVIAVVFIFSFLNNAFSQVFENDVVYDSDIDQGKAWEKALHQYREHNYREVISIYDTVYHASLKRVQNI